MGEQSSEEMARQLFVLHNADVMFMNAVHIGYRGWYGWYFSDTRLRDAFESGETIRSIKQSENSAICSADFSVLPQEENKHLLCSQDRSIVPDLIEYYRIFTIFKWQHESAKSIDIEPLSRKVLKRILFVTFCALWKFNLLSSNASLQSISSASRLVYFLPIKHNIRVYFHIFQWLNLHLPMFEPPRIPLTTISGSDNKKNGDTQQLRCGRRLSRVSDSHVRDLREFVSCTVCRGSVCRCWWSRVCCEKTTTYMFYMDDIFMIWYVHINVLFSDAMCWCI